jgi:hypothetical protein
MATPAAALSRAGVSSVKPLVHWHDRLAQGLLLVCCLAWSCSCWRRWRRS